MASRPRRNQLEFTYLITPDGEEYCFEDGIDAFLVQEVNPLGMPGIDIETQRSPFQHGETAVSYTLRPRLLTMVHRRHGRDRYDYWDLRQDTEDFIRPNRQIAWGRYDPCQLVKVLADGTKWALDVYFYGGLEFRAQTNWDEWSAQDAIRFLAPDPTFYDPDGTIETLAIVVAGTELAFPCAFPIIFQSEDTIDDSVVITYLGSWQALPVIEIDGPVTDIRIENSDTNELLELQYEIPIGDTVTIDCRSGQKTVTDSSGTNLIGSLTDDSDLGTFHLAPNPESPNGQNTIDVFGLDAATGVTEVRFSYATRMVAL